MHVYLKASLMIGATLALVWAGSARASESLDRFQGLVCSSPDGIKAVFTLHEKSSDSTTETLLSEIALINKSGNDCAIRNIMEIDREVVATFPWRGAYFDVRRVEVWATCHEGFCIMGQQGNAFIAAANKDTPS